MEVRRTSNTEAPERVQTFLLSVQALSRKGITSEALTGLPERTNP